MVPENLPRLKHPASGGLLFGSAVFAEYTLVREGELVTFDVSNVMRYYSS
jgi:hypothetical protein